jgi:hypothetical protein
MKIKLFFLLIFFANKVVTAQTAATNTGILYITGSGDIFHAGSDFTNNSGSALTNNGHLYIRGNLTNNQSSVAVGTGTLYLNGTSAQAVNGTQPFRTFNFISNNASGITLNNNLSVSGAHTFTSGIIATSATPNYLVYEAGSSYSGDADTRHVNGWVKKFGSTNFIFPVGNGTVERTVALNSLSANSEFNARYLGTTPNPYVTQLPVRVADWMEYWPITKVSGGTATVTMNWDAGKVYFPNWIVPDILAAGYNGSAWTDNGGLGTASGNPATTGTVTSSSISSFNLFTFGSISWVLPVTLTSFTAIRQDNYTRIDWITEKEFNLHHFIVERSDNGTNFYPISQLPARNSGNTEQYQVKDHAPITHIAYYRLRSVDDDGKESFSGIVAVVNKDNSDLLLLTNPVRNKVTLVATSQLSGDFRYQLSTMNGQVVQQGNLNIRNGGQHEIYLSGKLQPGSYALRVSNNQKTFYYKLLIL